MLVEPAKLIGVGSQSPNALLNLVLTSHNHRHLFRSDRHILIQNTNSGSGVFNYNSGPGEVMSNTGSGTFNNVAGDINNYITIKRSPRRCLSPGNLETASDGGESSLEEPRKTQALPRRKRLKL
ncbi:hypothetical protein HGRIS_002924 [Hohenbuehelia grisea]|uniref:Uncharacterized protein n=1 Tax=Hohenbuehelia grisea TaxID=104357 RepID=A0ABR3JND1_9AGAR